MDALVDAHGPSQTPGGSAAISPTPEAGPVAGQGTIFPDVDGDLGSPLTSLSSLSDDNEPAAVEEDDEEMGADEGEEMGAEEGEDVLTAEDEVSANDHSEQSSYAMQAQLAAVQNRIDALIDATDSRYPFPCLRENLLFHPAEARVTTYWDRVVAAAHIPNCHSCGDHIACGWATMDCRICGRTFCARYFNSW